METRSAPATLLLDPETRPELRVETVSDYQSFLDLEPVWNQLVTQAGIEHPFLEHVWVRTWWECFAATAELQVLVVRAGGRPIAIAPLILDTIRLYGIPVRRLGFFYNAHVPRADFLIAERHEEVYRAVWRHLSENHNWDLLQLCQLPAGSATLEQLPALAKSDDCLTDLWPSGPSPVVPLTGTWSQYLSSLPAKHRSNLRNRFRRLNELGPVAVEVVTSEEGLEDSLAAGLRLEAAAWKGDAGTAIRCGSETNLFYSELAREAAQRGWLLLHFLRAGRDHVAFDFSLLYANKIFLLKLGYEPAHCRYSPYNLLLSQVLEKAFERGVTAYEFLGINDEWKRNWTDHATPHYWLFIFSNSFQGRCLHFIKFRLIPWLKRYAAGLALDSKVRLLKSRFGRKGAS